MDINILDIQPSVINKSLSGKTLLLAGEPKIGKSEFCAQSKKTLICDLENGYNARPGVLKVKVTKWSELKLIVRQLNTPEAHEKYDNVAIDTINVAWDLCTKHVCQCNGVQSINDIPYGAGYKMRDDEFDLTLRQIIMMNYGLILTCHTKEKLISSDEQHGDVYSIEPNVDKRCLPLINAMVDIIGIINQTWTPDGKSQRWLITKPTPTVKAGSRWEYLPPKIPFGYDYLEKAIGDALDKQVENGAKVVDTVENNYSIGPDYTSLMIEARALWDKLVGEDDSGDNLNKILKKIEMIFGRKIRISEITEDQVDQLELVIQEMRNMANV